MRRRYSPTAVYAIVLLCAATSAQAGIVAPALDRLGGDLAARAGWFLSSCDRVLASIRPLVTGESWVASGEQFPAGRLIARSDLRTSTGWNGLEADDALGSVSLCRGESAADAAPEFGWLLADADLGSVLAAPAEMLQDYCFGSARAVVWDLASGADLGEIFADSSLRRKAPEPVSVLVWALLGLTWVGLRVMRRTRSGQWGLGLARRDGVAGRSRWSEENRAAIRRIIETGSPR